MAAVATRPLKRALSYRCNRQQYTTLHAAGSRLLQKQWRHFDICRAYTSGRSQILSASGANSRMPSSSRNLVAPNLSIQQQRRLISSSSIRPGMHRPPLPLQFLEAHDEQKFDPSTRQRNDVPFDPVDGKPPPQPPSLNNEDGKRESELSYNADNDKWRLTTKRKGSDDSKSSYYPNEWVYSQMERWHADANDFDSTFSSKVSNQIDTTPPATKRILWSNWKEHMVRDPNTSPILFHYHNLGNKEDPNTTEQERLLKALYQYGLVLITETPSYTESLPLDVMSEEVKVSHMINIMCEESMESADSAILNLASIIGYHPLQTLYGSGVWSTSSQSSFYNSNDGNGNSNSNNNNESASGGGASTADSAYGSTSLPLHTDMNYLSNPPGVQVFLMVQPATTASSDRDDNHSTPITPKGGQSVYLDGFAAAQQLQLENPDAFHLLATTPRTYRCIDENEGWHLEATGPLIETVPGGKNEWGPVKAIRHNDLDRLPDLPPYPTTDTAESDNIHNDTFYQKLKEAHEAWDEILRRDSMRLVIELEPGDCVLVANQRCLHGRYAFETSEFPRVVMGCYVGMDEMSSKFRKAGLRVL